MAAMAKVIQVRRGRKDYRRCVHDQEGATSSMVLVDGKEFPWFIRRVARAEFDVDNVPSVMVEIICDRVEFIDEVEAIPPIKQQGESDGC